MNPVAKVLIAVGIVFIIAGVLWQFSNRFFPLGRLPGDISIHKENFSFYFPLTTSILLSVILSLFFYLLNYFKR